MAKPRTEVRKSVRGKTPPENKAGDAKRRGSQTTKSASRTFKGYDVYEGRQSQKTASDAKRRAAKPTKSVVTQDKNFKGYDVTKGKPKTLEPFRCKERPKDNKPKGSGGTGKRFVPWC